MFLIILVQIDGSVQTLGAWFDSATASDSPGAVSTTAGTVIACGRDLNHFCFASLFHSSFSTTTSVPLELSTPVLRSSSHLQSLALGC
jgi:hypothetical protein